MYFVLFENEREREKKRNEDIVLVDKQFCVCQRNRKYVRTRKQTKPK